MKKGGDTMMEKRYLMILSVAVVSVLLGSLFYSNLTLADRAREPTPVEVTNLPVDEEGNLKVRIVDDRPLQTFNASVKIDVLGWVTRQWTSGTAQMEFGVAISSDYTADLAFVFQPRKSDFNITEIYVVFFATGNVNDFSLTINGAGIFESHMPLTVDLVTARRYPLDPNVVLIEEGINLLSMSCTSGSYLSVQEVEVFIEYEYQA